MADSIPFIVFATQKDNDAQEGATKSLFAHKGDEEEAQLKD